MNRHAWLQKHPSPQATRGEFHWYPEALDAGHREHRELRAGFVERVRGVEPPAVLWRIEPGRVAWGQVFAAIAPLDGRRYVGLVLSVVEDDLPAAELLAMLAPPPAAPWTAESTASGLRRTAGSGHRTGFDSSKSRRASTSLAVPVEDLLDGSRRDLASPGLAPLAPRDAAGVARALMTDGPSTVADPPRPALGALPRETRDVAGVARALMTDGPSVVGDPSGPALGALPRETRDVAGVARALMTGGAFTVADPPRRDLGALPRETRDVAGVARALMTGGASTVAEPSRRDLATLPRETRDVAGVARALMTGGASTVADPTSPDLPRWIASIERLLPALDGKPRCGVLHAAGEPRSDAVASRSTGPGDRVAELVAAAWYEPGSRAAKAWTLLRELAVVRGESVDQVGTSLASVNAGAVLTAAERADLAGCDRVVDVLHAWGRGRLDRSVTADTLTVRLAELVALRVLERLAGGEDASGAIAEARWHALLPAQRRTALLAAVAERTASLRELVEAHHGVGRRAERGAERGVERAAAPALEVHDA